MCDKFISYNVLFIHQGPNYYPSCYPIMPKEEILESQVLHKMVMELASILEVRGLFHEHSEMD